MATNRIKEVSVDVRQIAKEHFTIHVQYKKEWLFNLGLFFIKIGCWISGINYVEEFPMSLLDKSGNPIRLEK